jgi:hypothetical protein
MARIVDYGTLQTAVTEWLWRTGDTQVQGRADAFIDFFEKKFKRKQRTQQMEETDTTALATASVPLPLGYLEMVRLQIVSQKQPLTYVTPAIAAVMDASTQGVPGGVARYYTVLSGQVIITPQAYSPAGGTLEMVYYSFTQLKDAPLGVNWLVIDHADIYLYGSLMQAAAYIDDKEMVAFWKAGLDEAMDELLKADNRAKVGAGPLIMRPSTSFRR